MNGNQNRIQCFLFRLERIADGEVEGVHVAEALDIEIAGAAGLVGHMETEAPVNADDEELEVVAQAETGAGGKLVERERARVKLKVVIK